MQFTYIFTYIFSHVIHVCLSKVYFIFIFFDVMQSIIDRRLNWPNIKWKLKLQCFFQLESWERLTLHSWHVRVDKMVGSTDQQTILRGYVAHVSRQTIYDEYSREPRTECFLQEDHGEENSPPEAKGNDSEGKLRRGLAGLIKDEPAINGNDSHNKEVRRGLDVLRIVRKQVPPTARGRRRRTPFYWTGVLTTGWSSSVHRRKRL